MSGTDPVATTTTTPTPVQSDSLYSQAFIYAMCLLPLAAGVLVGAFKYLSPEVAATLAGTALGLTLGGPTGYFYGAAKHQPATPTTPTTVPGATTTTTVTPPATTTTVTPP